jgi:site-specific DNA-methyltransferase (adenine-specific)
VPPSKPKAPRNRTLTLSPADWQAYGSRLQQLTQATALDAVLDTTLQQDCQAAIAHLPTACIDLLILDPPYNLRKNFNGQLFQSRSPADYLTWFASWLLPLKRLLKPTASVYVCADWQSSVIVYPLLAEHFTVRNRITWER